MAERDTPEGAPNMSVARPTLRAVPEHLSGPTRPPPSAVRAIGGRLLLVDDEAPLLRGLTRLMGLATPQWRITTALNAEQALTALDREVFDVLVTDLEMPGMGGLALLEVATLRFPEMVRVVHSSHSNARAEQLAHFSLGKPVSSDVLISTVGSAFAASLARQNPNDPGRSSQTG